MAIVLVNIVASSIERERMERERMERERMERENQNYRKDKMPEMDRASTGNAQTFYMNEMDQEFLMAAKCGDVAKVKECLKNGVDINVTSPGGLNALHFAARENHYDVAKYVIDCGIDAKAITKRLNSALHIAALGGHTSIASLLIKCMCPINGQAMDDITPLYMASQENHIDTVKLLLKHHADPHLAAKGGYEPVDIAIQQGHLALQEGNQHTGYGKVVQMLLQHKGGLRALHVAARRDDPKALALLLSENLDINEKAPNGYTPLHVAAKNGSANSANYLIDLGADLNSTAKGGVVPLHVASRHGQLTVLSALIEAGANLEIATNDGLTALHCAARNGHHHCVELLVVRGAPLTAKTKHGLTALHMAAQANHVTSAKHIITHGAHIDDVTSDGVTSLHVCAHYGHVETCQLLIERGANIDQKAKNGYTALHIASKKNREPIIQLLLNHTTNVNIKNNNGQIPLHVAAFFGHVNIVLQLLQSGSALEAKTIRDETVLHIACRTNQIQIVRLLLRNGANVNARSKDEDTPLHNACRQGSSSLVNLLLDNRGDPNCINKEGCCPMHLAARDNQEKIIDSLLDHNADVSVLSKRGYTPLHEAVKKGHMQIIEMLLERKANVNAVGKNGLTPLHFACHYDRPDVAVKLLNHGADPHAIAKNGFSALHISAEKNQVNIISMLLERGVEVDLLTAGGVNPLHLAAKEGNVDVVDLLLEHGASPCVQSVTGLTPLHVAVHYNQIEVVSKLLKYGASLETQTKSGFTPLHLACLHGHYDVAEQLLSDGSDVEAKTKNGNTPLHIAAYKGHLDIVELLLKYNAPPNALNKDGYSALYVAEITDQSAVAKVLSDVTKVVVKGKSARKESESSMLQSERIKSAFLNPESLEECSLLGSLDETEEEAHIQKKVIKEDFEESFAGLDDSRSEIEHSLPPSVVSESMGEVVTESFLEISQEQDLMTSNSEDFLLQLEESDSGINSDMTAEVQDSLTDGVGALINGDVSQPILDSTTYNVDSCSGPQKQGRFLVSFNVDARGCVMESKHTGVKVIVPRGACRMPTRITARLRKSIDVMHLPQLSVNEALVSRVVQLSPAGTEFLKPVIFEIPHYAALKEKQRELVAFVYATQTWREHGTSVHEDEPDSKVEEQAASMKVITQEVPEKIVVISRPRKERFVMLPEGGTVESTCVPNVKVIFPPDTLSTSTKVVLQVQLNEDSLLHPEEQTHVSPIISLEPPTTISKPITVIVPCGWLNKIDKTGGRNVRLLAWLTRSPRRSVVDRVEHEWRDITANTGLSIVDDYVKFETSEFTKYWVVQTNSPETLTKRINQIQQTISATPFSVRFFIYGRLKSPRHAELRVFVVTDEHAKDEFLESIQGFKELSRSNYHHLHSGQTVHINLVGNIAPIGSQNLKLQFHPFQINRLKISTEAISTEDVLSCRVTLIGSLRKDGSDNISSLCTLAVSLSTDMVAPEKSTYPEDTVNDEIIATVGRQITETWVTFARELNMGKRDKQAVEEISTGKRDIPSVRLLEYWRSKNPTAATYKALYDALKRAGLDDVAENVYNSATRKFSLDVLARERRERDGGSISDSGSSSEYSVTKEMPGEGTTFSPVPEEMLPNCHSDTVFEEVTVLPTEEQESSPTSYENDLSDQLGITDDSSALERPSSPLPTDEHVSLVTDGEGFAMSLDIQEPVSDINDSFALSEEDRLSTPDDLVSRSIDDLSSISPSVSSISPDLEFTTSITGSCTPFPECGNTQQARHESLTTDVSLGYDNDVDSFDISDSIPLEKDDFDVNDATFSNDNDVDCTSVVITVSNDVDIINEDTTKDADDFEELSSDVCSENYNSEKLDDTLDDSFEDYTTPREGQLPPLVQNNKESDTEKTTDVGEILNDSIEDIDPRPCDVEIAPKIAIVESNDQVVLSEKQSTINLDMLNDSLDETQVEEDVNECETTPRADPVINFDSLEDWSDDESEPGSSVCDVVSVPSPYQTYNFENASLASEKEEESVEEIQVRHREPKDLVCEGEIIGSKIEDNLCQLDDIEFNEPRDVCEGEIIGTKIEDNFYELDNLEFDKLDDFSDSSRHVISPSHDHEITPSHDDEITPSHDHAITPSHDHEITPSHDDVITPSHDVITPSQDDAITPSHDDAITPSHENAITPSHDHAITPSHENGDPHTPHHYTHRTYSEEIITTTTVVKKVAVVSDHDHSHHEDEPNETGLQEVCCTDATIATEETQVTQVTKRVITNDCGLITSDGIENTAMIQGVLTEVESNECFNGDVPSLTDSSTHSITHE